MLLKKLLKQHNEIVDVDYQIGKYAGFVSVEYLNNSKTVKDSLANKLMYSEVKELKGIDTKHGVLYVDLK